jgi:hypothetical protein
LLFASATEARSREGHGENSQKKAEHSEVAGSQDEGDGESGQGAAQVHALAKPAQKREGHGDCEGGQHTRGLEGRRVNPRQPEDTHDRGGGDKGNPVGDTELAGSGQGDSPELCIVLGDRDVWPSVHRLI